MTSSTEFFSNVASTTGALITDSFPLWAILVGAVIAIFGILLIVRGFEKMLRMFRK